MYTFGTITKFCISLNLLSLVACTFVGAQKMGKVMKYLHNKFQILTQTHKIVSCLMYFQCTHNCSSSHFGMMMSYDVAGGGPMEAPIVDLSVPALKLFQSHLVYSLWLSHCSCCCVHCVVRGGWKEAGITWGKTN